MIALRLFLLMSVLTGVIYPVFVTGIAKVLFPRLSSGSLIERQGKIVGSELIAQSFKDPKYFWPRPSFTNYETVPSSGSNYGPTNAHLKKMVEERKGLPGELIFNSGSGLDPHISLSTARFQISRIAKARNIPVEKLEHLIQTQLINGSYINVLNTNMALDES